MIFCPKCGSRSESGKFCRLCGTNLALVSDALGDADTPGRVVATRGGGTTLGLLRTPTVSNLDRDLDGHSACSIFGGVTIDMSASQLHEGETSISVFATR